MRRWRADGEALAAAPRLAGEASEVDESGRPVRCGDKSRIPAGMMVKEKVFPQNLLNYIYVYVYQRGAEPNLSTLLQQLQLCGWYLLFYLK